MSPEDIVREAIEAFKSFLLGLMLAGIVAFGAGYYTGRHSVEHSQTIRK